MDIKAGIDHIGTEDCLQEIPIKDRIPELDLAIRATVEAGDALLEIYGKKVEARTKSDGSPVTEADMKSNAIIKKILSAIPHRILSEEDMDDEQRLQERVLWVVDPLDGTWDFIDKTDEFTVMIALVRDKRPVLGVINWPVGKTIFAAQLGNGAFMHSGGRWERIMVTEVSELAECRVVGSRHHLSESVKRLVRNLGVAKFVSVGSSLKVGKISSGKAEAYISPTDKMKEWDSAASCCIINEAGGRMTDMLGNDITYNNRDVSHQNGILVTNGLVHDRIIDEFGRSE